MTSVLYHPICFEDAYLELSFLVDGGGGSVADVR